MGEFVRPKIVISDDTMAAFVILPHGPVYTVDDLREALRGEGVTHGISVKALLEAVKGNRGMIYQVAWGTIDRKSAKTEAGEPVTVFRFPKSVGRPPSVHPVGPGFLEGWQSMIALGTVREGDVLCFVRNPERCRRGTGVTGLPVLLGQDRPAFRASQTTSVSKDGKSLLAKRAGIPYIEDGVASVLDHVIIQGNVGRKTGDLAFPGDITVQGDVDSGFRVSAGQNLIVEGSLSGSAAAGGQIAVRGGINAPGESVESGRGIYCRFMENSLVRTTGPVTVTEAVVHSVVETEEGLRVTDPSGRIVGGRIRAGRGVIVNTAGSSMGVPTVIEVGISPKYRREFSKLERDLQRIRQELDDVKRSSLMTKMGREYDSLRLKRVSLFLESQEKELSEKLSALKERMRKLGRPGHFWAEHVLPGTKLAMGVSVTEFRGHVEGLRMGVIRGEAH